MIARLNSWLAAPATLRFLWGSIAVQIGIAGFTLLALAGMPS